MRRTLSLLLTLCLVAGFAALPVTAEEPPAETPAVPTTDAFSEEVRYSVTDSNLTGWGLAFSFTLEAQNVKKTSTGYTNLNDASFAYGGETCTITRIGAVTTHLVGVGDDDARMVRETASDRRDIKDIRIARMYRADETSCTFAVRIINIPYEREEQPLYVRPYVEILYEGEKVTLYGSTASASYAQKAAETFISLPFSGTDIDGKGRLFVGEAAVLNDTLYLEIQDELDEWITMFNPDRPDVIYYDCYDKSGEKLTQDTYFYIRDMGPDNASETFEIPLPEGTAVVKITGAEIIYWTDWE